MLSGAIVLRMETDRKSYISRQEPLKILCFGKERMKGDTAFSKCFPIAAWVLMSASGGQPLSPLEQETMRRRRVKTSDLSSHWLLF